MEKLTETIDETNEFRGALKKWIRARAKAVVLEQDLKHARSRAYLDSTGNIHSERWARVDLETKDIARKAEMAKLRATAIFYLMLHLKGGDDVLDVDLDEQ